MKRTYELTVVFTQASTDLTKIAKSLENLIEKAQGKVVSKEDWGIKELSYPIRKQTKGVYWFHKLELPADNVIKLDKSLRLMPEVIRYLIVRAEE